MDQRTGKTVSSWLQDCKPDTNSYSRHEGYCALPIPAWLAEPDQSALRLRIYRPHEPNLPIPLESIRLVDADSVRMKSSKEGFGYRQSLIVAENACPIT